MCFSKGLGAPVGSCLAGPGEFIKRARRFRKMFGGGMRQSGIIAAGALFALRNHRSRLAEDHANARALAEGLAKIPGLAVDLATVETNIVCFDVTAMPAPQLVNELAARDVLVLARDARSIRTVANLMVTAADIGAALGVFREAVKAGMRTKE